MKKRIVLKLGFIMFVFFSCLGNNNQQKMSRKEFMYNALKDDVGKLRTTSSTGYVPNEETAIRIAEAIWRPIYGGRIDSVKPFEAILFDSIWVVRGTYDGYAKVPHIEIKKSDGAILFVAYGI